MTWEKEKAKLMHGWFWEFPEENYQESNVEKLGLIAYFSLRTQYAVKL